MCLHVSLQTGLFDQNERQYMRRNSDEQCIGDAVAIFVIQGRYQPLYIMPTHELCTLTSMLDTTYNRDLAVMGWMHTKCVTPRASIFNLQLSYFSVSLNMV